MMAVTARWFCVQAWRDHGDVRGDVQEARHHPCGERPCPLVLFGYRYNTSYALRHFLFQNNFCDRIQPIQRYIADPI